MNNFPKVLNFWKVGFIPADATDGFSGRKLLYWPFFPPLQSSNIPFSSPDHIRVDRGVAKYSGHA